MVGVKADAVSVVDETGALLGGTDDATAQLSAHHKLEREMEQRITSLLEASRGEGSVVTTDDDFVRAEQVRRSLGYLLGDLGHAAQRAGKKEMAESVFAEAVAVWAALNRGRPQNEEYEEGLSWSRQRLDEL